MFLISVGTQYKRCSSRNQNCSLLSEAPQVLESSASVSGNRPVKRGKLLNLERGKEQVALFVELVTTNEADIEISLEV